MKESIIVLALFCLATASAVYQCCEDGALMRPRGYCTGSSKRINRNCTNGHFLLKDIILNGTMLATQDSPNFIFAEDPEELKACTFNRLRFPSEVWNCQRCDKSGTDGSTSSTNYCVGEMYRNETDRSLGIMPAAVVCFEPPSGNSASAQAGNLKITGILLLVSVVFLVLTLIVYSVLPKLRDLQGLCYMNMCVSMAIGLLSLSILQFTPGYIGQNMCAFTGFTLYFWMIATFFWMNVVSINVYRTVTNTNHLKMSERNQYAIYSCYAWGSTMALLFIALVTNYVEGDHYKPGIGFNNACWFRGTTETFIFFYGPIAILIAVNIALFIISSVQLWMDAKKYEASTLNNLRYRFLLSLKLFLVMGISWIFEIISFIHGESHIIWTIMDTFNCLQGLVIFLLLVVLRKRAMMGLAEEGCCRGVTRFIADRVSPHDDSDDKQILTDEHVEVRLN